MSGEVKAESLVAGPIKIEPQLTAIGATIFLLKIMLRVPTLQQHEEQERPTPFPAPSYRCLVDKVSHYGLIPCVRSIIILEPILLFVHCARFLA